MCVIAMLHAKRLLKKILVEFPLFATGEVFSVPVTNASNTRSDQESLGNNGGTAVHTF